jgi:AcrR family transcriptional regulator
VPLEGERKADILATAASVFATSGLRASLQEVADACGILPGSLYHHFESKEAIFIELVEQYQAELDTIAEKAHEALRADPRPPEEQIVALGTAIAECAVRHRAALLLTFYEPHAGASEELVRLASRTPTEITAAMFAILHAARSERSVRSGVDLQVLADRLCQSMLHVGIGVYSRTRGAERFPAAKCQMLLHGAAVHAPDDARLDRSKAMRAADDVIKTWDDDRPDGRDKRFHISAVARAEFAKRGYELTTVRDIAAAAGVSTGAVYRMIDSKDDLLVSIMQAYVDNVTTGWTQIVESPSTPVEQLDALVWFNINVVHRFPEEHKIQQAGLRKSPPTSPDLTMSFTAQLRQLKTLVSDGLRAGQLQVGDASLEMASRCVFALAFTPENIIQDLGVRRALRFDRETFLRGAAVRS